MISITSITGPRSDDYLIWVHPSESCSSLDNTDNIRNATTTSTATFHVTTNGFTTLPALDYTHGDLAVGTYIMCYKPSGGVYTMVNSGNLTVFEHPTYFPNVGISSSETAITFYGTAVLGDYVHFTSRDNCTQAHLDTTTTTTNLGRTALADFTGPLSKVWSFDQWAYVDRLGLNVPTSMSHPTAPEGRHFFRVCYAASESGGVSYN